MDKKVVFVCSPYSGNVEENLRMAREYSRSVVDRGCVPVTPHLMYPQFMDDNNSEDRARALDMNKRLIEHCCDEVWWFGKSQTPGMREELLYAESLGKPIFKGTLPRRFIIMTNGYGGCGKDTFCRMVHDAVRSEDFIAEFGETFFRRYSYVECTRQMLRNAGIDITNKSDELRELMVKVNAALEEYHDFPFRDVCGVIEEQIPAGYSNHIVMVDARDPDVIDRIVRTYNNVLALLVRRSEVSAGVGDNYVDDYTYDVIVDNRNPAELKSFAEKFARSLLSAPSNWEPRFHGECIHKKMDFRLK